MQQQSCHPHNKNSNKKKELRKSLGYSHANPYPDLNRNLTDFHDYQ